MNIDSSLLMALLAALTAGFAGSGHCLAMCGGMAGLLNARRDAASNPVRRSFFYNAGRLSSYTLAGVLAGGIGSAIGFAAGMGTAAGQLRIISGAIIVIAGLYLLTGRRIFAPFEKLGERAWRFVAPGAVRQLQRDGNLAVFTLGMLWGWLPCGLTWSMLAIAAASTQPLHGGAIVLAFGLGTLPAMLAVGLAGFRLRGLLQRTSARRVAALILLVAGLWTAAVPLTGQHSTHASRDAAHATHHH